MTRNQIAEVNRNFDGTNVVGTLDENDNLVWRLTDVGREALAELREENEARRNPANDDVLFIELAEDILGGCCEIIRPSEIGAMVSEDMMIISDDCSRDDRDDIEHIGRVWFDANYAVSFALQDMERVNGTSVWRILRTDAEQKERGLAAWEADAAKAESHGNTTLAAEIRANIAKHRA